MSDIEREEFEQAVADKWSDSYSFTRFENGEYMDDFLQQYWIGWQASRQEGEPIGFLQSSGVSQLSGGHPAKLYPIGATPSPFESSTLVYTHPASAAPDEEYLRALQDAFDIIQADANTEENYGSMCRIGSVLDKLKDTPTNADVWIKCSERMPTVNDADFDGYVWWARFNHVARTKQRIVVDGLEHLDDAFWMPTNLTLTQPQPPKQEQGQ
jgi:hypothetical protein